MAMNLVRSLSCFKELGKFRSLYTTSHDMKVAYLKQSIAEYNRPDQLAKLMSQHPEIGQFKRSAVLVPISVRLVKNEKGNRVQKSFYMLSKRAEHMKTFKGQTCFVGGMVDGQDKNATETALREAHEEIGLEAEHLTILGQLSPIITAGGVLMTPVLAFYDHEAFQPKLNKNEVDFIFDLPTDRFINSHNHEAKAVKLRNNDEYYVHWFQDEIQGRVIKTWGATALICIAVSSMLHSRAPTFQVDPKFEYTKDNINEYFDWNLLANVQRIKNVASRKPKS